MTDQSQDWLLDPESVRALLAEVARSDVDEVELFWGSRHVRLQRSLRHRVVPSQIENSQAEPRAALSVSAPLAGAFYLRPSPDQPPYVSVGDAVGPGQTVGLIETMKVFNEVTSAVEGVVEEIAVNEGQLVEQGQALIYMRPSDGILP